MYMQILLAAVSKEITVSWLYQERLLLAPLNVMEML